MSSCIFNSAKTSPNDMTCFWQCFFTLFFFFLGISSIPVVGERIWRTYSSNMLQAWKLWNEGRPLELMNITIDDSSSLSEILRHIQVGLLCVQQRPDDRPSMSTVVVMLSSEISLPQPKQPGFYTERNFPEPETSSSSIRSASRNDISFTVFEPR
jgi:hypothetical protein